MVVDTSLHSLDENKTLIYRLYSMKFFCTIGYNKTANWYNQIIKTIKMYYFWGGHPLSILNIYITRQLVIVSGSIGILKISKKIGLIYIRLQNK